MQEVATTLFKDEFKLGAGHKSEQVLDKIVRGREPLAIIPGDQSEPFTSLLLQVDRDRDELVIDDLNPERGNARIADGHPFFCMGRADGVYVGFQTHFLSAIEWEGYGALRVAFPTAVYYLQRRGNFRVPADTEAIGDVEIERRGARMIVGECKDISSSGMRLQFTAPSDYALSEGEYLPHVRFHLDGLEMICEAQVRFVRSQRSRDNPAQRTLGIRFVNSSTAFEQRVTSYVQRRDRERLRDQRG